jgi:hypothetical protein
VGEFPRRIGKHPAQGSRVIVKVELNGEDLGGDYRSLRIREGESIGKGKESTDTNVPLDFAYPVGIHPRGITPTAQNQEFSDSPLINEVLFNKDPESFLDERQMLIEV